MRLGSWKQHATGLSIMCHIGREGAAWIKFAHGDESSLDLIPYLPVLLRAADLIHRIQARQDKLHT
jgi:hypothetical protein